MKKTSSPAMPPKTDVEALLDIVGWSRSRPAWQRQVLHYLVQQEEPTSDQIEELTLISRNSGTASSPLTEADVRSPKSQTSAVTLKAVSKPEDVNALAPDQTLSFEKTGLTIIYGDNGAGKSGYARILKHACRARIDGRAHTVIPNIFAQAPGTPRATISYSVNGQIKQAHWQLHQESPAELSAISVFDARTAAVHVDGTNEVAYVPSSLDLLQRLAKAADAIKIRARQAKEDIEAQTPLALRNPPIDHGTQAAKVVLQLQQDTDLAELLVLGTLSDQERIELADLQRDLSGDPGKAARQLANTIVGLGRFSTSIQSICRAANSAILLEMKALHDAAVSARTAADAAAQNRFASDPLPNVGSDVWRVLWESARHYATMEAMPSQPFPPALPTDYCPLCQQKLSTEAIDRFARFEAFIRDDTKRKADEAENAYRARLKELNSFLPKMHELLMQLRYLRDTLGHKKSYDAARRCSVAARWQLRRILRDHADPNTSVENIDDAPALEALGELSRALQAREVALSAEAGSQERRALIAKLRELEARAWLGKVLPDIEAEISRKKELVKLEHVLSEADTRAITQKSSQIAEALVTDTLRAQFAKEIAALGVGDLAVELKKEGSQAGAARFRVRLVRKPNAVVGAVLSEGENRCVALAAFLAELSTSGSKSAIIFDDPVSSLDHRYREEVASRLAAEARERQVVVLTHDLAFLMLLSQAAADLQVHTGYRCIARGGEFAGYCSTELPFNARPIEDALNALEADLKNKAVQYERGMQAEWRNAVKST